MAYYTNDKEKEKIGKLIIKIGVSIHPEERLKELQTGNHNKLIILRTIKCPDYKTLEKNKLYIEDINLFILHLNQLKIPLQ